MTETTTAGTAVDRAKEASGEVRQQAADLASDLRDQSRQVLSRTRDEVNREASARTDQFAGTLHAFAGELRTMADADDEGRLGGLARGAADRADEWGRRLEERGFEGVVDDVRRAVRRRPGMVLGVAAVSGFLIGRLVRESAPIVQQQSGNGTSAGYARSSSPGQLGEASPPSAETWDASGARAAAAAEIGAIDADEFASRDVSQGPVSRDV